MNTVFSKEGFAALRNSWILLALSLVAATAIGAGGHWITVRDQREGTLSEKRLQEARSRLEGARRERDSLAESAEVFRSLVERGILQDERRLDLVEHFADLRERHRLQALDYDIAPQRPLPGTSYASVEVLASRVKVKARALHEGDALAFLEELSRSPRGLYPVDRCTLRRLSEAATARALNPRVEAECGFEWITLRERKGAARAG